MKVCIFCFRNDDDVDFSVEHIIPKSLHGRLVLPEHVCKDCNDRFGSEIDHTILKNPQILRAIETLNLSKDRSQLINQNYVVHGTSADLKVHGRATSRSFEFPPQDLPDGSRIHPEGDFEEPLRKTLLRDQSLYAAGLSAEDIMAEYNLLIDDYRAAAVGEPVENKRIGVKLIKRSDSFKIDLQPRGPDDVSRLVAKIAYEFGFFMTGLRFLDCQDVSEPIRLFVLTGEDQKELHIIRSNAQSNTYDPVHFISLQVYDHVTRFVVGLFGAIAYSLLAPPCKIDLLGEVKDRFDCPTAIGVEYQQDISANTIGFWALLPDNKVMYLRL